MFDLVALNLSVLLKQIFNNYWKPLERSNLTQVLSDKNKKITKRQQKIQREAPRTSIGNDENQLSLLTSYKCHDRVQASLLDLSGPQLLKGLGFRNLLCLVGFLNWFNRPLYLSLIYKAIVWSAISLRIVMLFLNYYKYNIYTDVNPIFFLTSILFSICSSAQIAAGMYLTTFKYDAIESTLAKKQLCFLRIDVLELIGFRTLQTFIYLSIIQSILIIMITKKDLNDFLTQFNVITFTLDIITFFPSNSLVFGLGFLDFYARCSFGHWLLALRDHLEKQFSHLSNIASRSSNRCARNRKTGTKEIQLNIEIITLDQIQRSINNMDDHLERWRNLNSMAVTLSTLCSFLAEGIWLLNAYHQIQNLNDRYHGILHLLMVLNYHAFVFIGYLGDSWLDFCLKSLVACIEDTYFLQHDDILNQSLSYDVETRLIRYEIRDHLSYSSASKVKRNSWTKIRKKHILFFKEFLKQFENHMGTSWSHLTFKSNLQMIRAFVTLIAAQIVFDHVS